MKQRLSSVILTLAATTAALAVPATPEYSCCPSATNSGRPDSHAPISVMGDHTHHKGGWMLSYRLMRMDMNDMRKGTNDVSSPDIFAANYTVAPERMTMDMHMFGFMYAASDKLTLMAMRNYIESDMSHRIHPGSGMLIAANGGSEQFTTKTSGWGDTQLTALYKFYDKDQQKAHLGLGLNLPTGSVAAKDRIPMMRMGHVNSVLPAPMQLGSGTYDLLPSLTFRQQFEEWSYGVQASGIVRLQDNNDRDYRHGHQFGLTSWAGYVLSDWISLGGGLSYKWSGTLKGDQQDINQGPMMGRNTVTTAYGDNYGGERIDAILGVNLLGPKGALKGHRLAADIRLPLWQDLHGYQMATDWVLTLGWQKAW